jgi:hypothetical protein
MKKRVALRLAGLGQKVRQLERQGMDTEAAREKALVADLDRDSATVVMDTVVECMRAMVLKSATINRPAVTRLHPCHAALFSLSCITGIGPSLTAYATAISLVSLPAKCKSEISILQLEACVFKFRYDARTRCGRDHMHANVWPEPRKRESVANTVTGLW